MECNQTEVSPEGILLIDKEEGKTSFDAVRMIRRVLRCKKTGHAGTLDPFATGLLVILLGQGTKLSSHIMGGKKKYLAEIRLGAETDTGDPTGAVIKEIPVPHITDENIAEAADHFTGVIEQVPPAFSAVKVNGQRAYMLARKGVGVKLKKREVTVYSIDIIDVRLPVITLVIACSAGTYIRSLALDIGIKLGTVAHVTRLRRLSSGSFRVDDALALNAVEFTSGELLMNRIIPLHESLPDMKTVKLDHHLAGRVRHGYRPSWNELTEKINFSGVFKGSLKLIDDSNLVAVMEVDRSGTQGNNWLKKVTVFN